LPSGRSYYSRGVGATTIPSLTNYDELEEAARQTAEGAAYIAMALPSATEVDALRGPFKTLRAQTQTAEANTNKQQEDVSALYSEA
jgi:HAMP domain-containing protein